MATAAEKPVLGTIDCPICGEVEGMAVKHDKNGDPFGHCEECSGQLRIGGKPGRVRKFCKRYPWAAVGAAPAVPVTVTVTGEKPAVPVAVAPVAPPVAPVKRNPFADALNLLGA